MWLWPVQGVAAKLVACVAEAEHCSVNKLLQHLQVLSTYMLAAVFHNFPIFLCYPVRLLH